MLRRCVLPVFSLLAFIAACEARDCAGVARGLATAICDDPAVAPDAARFEGLPTPTLPTLPPDRRHEHANRVLDPPAGGDARIVVDADDGQVPHEVFVAHVAPDCAAVFARRWSASGSPAARGVNAMPHVGLTSRKSTSSTSGAVTPVG